MTITCAYRHGDEPIAVNGVFATRIQNFTATVTNNLTPRFELGNFTTVGVSESVGRYTGNYTFFPIDNLHENLWAGLAATGSPIGLDDYIAIGGVPLRTHDATYTGCKITSIEYAVANPEAEFSATLNWEGTGVTGGTGIAITSPSGAGAYTGKDVIVSVNGQTGMRVSGLTLRANIPAERLMELSNADPVCIRQDSPEVTADIDFYESDAAAGNSILALATPGNIVVTVNGASTKQITLYNMVSGPTKYSRRKPVRGWATRRYSYTSSGEATNYAMLVTTV
jgi:hypothetical protein